MIEQNYFKFTNSVVVAPLVSILLIWTVFWIELRLHVNLNEYGVFPRTLQGARGVLFGPFIHSSLEHLYNNTIPIAILMASLFYFYKNVAMKTLFIGFLFSGILTWLIGRPAYHIGVSGIIYFLASFIFFRGILTKYYRLVALSLVVVFIYGSLLWYIFPIKEGISWEGHLSGFLIGILLAVFTKSEVPSTRKFDWEREDYNEEEDEFLKHFDENGNFVESPKNENEDIHNTITINYDYKRSGETDTE